jgi:hypothetical protein
MALKSRVPNFIRVNTGMLPRLMQPYAPLAVVSGWCFVCRIQLLRGNSGEVELLFWENIALVHILPVNPVAG